MKDLYNSELDTAQNIVSDVESCIYLISTLRSILHTVSVVTYELVIDYAPASIKDEIDINKILNVIHHPTEGAIVSKLDLMVPVIRSYKKANFLYGWYEKTNSNKKNLCEKLQELIPFRNSRIGHGVLDENSASEWRAKLVEIITTSLQVFSDCIPKINGDRLYLNTFDEITEIKSSLTYNNKPIVILKIENIKGIWKLKGQVLSNKASKEFKIQLSSDCPLTICTPESHSKFLYRELETKEGPHSILTNLPSRQTDIFEGRKLESTKLIEWLDDYDSRMCLIYGDGGVGKTTLALEFLNSVLEEDYELSIKKPGIICYFTAKMTRWTESGIIHYKGVSTAVEDILRELILSLQDSLGKEWYTINGKSLVDKTKTELQEQGFDRDDIVLVIDNAETLAASPEEMDQLSEILQQISKKIGRIIVTSRRREIIEARPIQITPLSEEEAVAFLKRLAEDIGAKSIIQAGDARIKKIAKTLTCKPLLLDILTRYIARAEVGIDDAISKIMKESTGELVDFLYEDAWMRISESHKNVFIILTLISSPINHMTVGWACKESNIQHDDWQRSLDQTYFGTIINYGNNYEIVFTDLAVQFFVHKLGTTSNANRDKLKNLAEKIDSYALEAEKIEREYKTDRVAEAFNHHFAKAAKIAAEKDNLEEAQDWYKLALKEQPYNAPLHDRYAWFLLNKQKNPNAAREVATEALKIEKDNADAALTMGLVEYQLYDIPSGDYYIKRAVKLGKPQGLGFLRMGIARYRYVKNNSNSKETLRILDEAENYFVKANKEFSPHQPYFRKNITEIEKFRKLIIATRKRVLNSNQLP